MGMLSHDLPPRPTGSQCKRCSILNVKGMTPIKNFLCLSVAFHWGCQTELAPARIFPSDLYCYLSFVMTSRPFCCSGWPTSATEQHYHSCAISGDSTIFFSHLKTLFCWSLFNLLRYCELWSPFVLLPADKNAFAFSWSQYKKSNPVSICACSVIRAWTDIGGQWEQPGLGLLLFMGLNRMQSKLSSDFWGCRVQPWCLILIMCSEFLKYSHPSFCFINISY